MTAVQPKLISTVIADLGAAGATAERLHGTPKLLHTPAGKVMLDTLETSGNAALRGVKELGLVAGSERAANEVGFVAGDLAFIHDGTFSSYQAGNVANGFDYLMGHVLDTINGAV